MRVCLLDTGPLIAYLVAQDPAHDATTAWFAEYSGRLATTSAVITEAMHFVAASRRGPEFVAEFVAITCTAIHGSERSADLRAAAALMRRYDNVPMDYADATLLLLADRLELDEIATLDRRGFSTYRTPAGKALTLAFDLVTTATTRWPR